MSSNNATNNGYGIYLYLSFGNTLSGNNATNNSCGIGLWYSFGNMLSSNNATNNDWSGIYLDTYSDNNTLSGNNATNNWSGIALEYSDGNMIYHNNFIDNTLQVWSYASTNVWDDGYPSGGNYWSDYTGLDLYSGLNQDQPGSDGIGDTPYVIYDIYVDAKNQDRYPLMNPWAEFIVATVDFEPDTLNLKSEGEYVTVYIELPEGYDVGAINASSIMLNGTIQALSKPKPSTGDYDMDGIPDLMVKFSRSEVKALFPGPGTYTIEITGTLNGDQFKGYDTVKVE